MKKKVQGTPLYIYKGDTYFDRPRGTRCVKMKYDKEENVTFITLKKNFYFLEILALLVAVGTILSVFVFKPKFDNLVNYSTPVEWYNGNININLTANEENKLPIEYDINGVTGILLPGEVLDTIPCEQQPETITATFKINFLIFSKDISEVVPVYNLSAEVTE